MEHISVAELEQTGGKPSGNFGSSYSEIHTVVGKLDNLETTGNYLNIKHQELTFKLEKKVAAYVKSRGGFDKAVTQKKAMEIKAVAELNELMTDQVQKAKIGALLDKMSRDGMALIRNTGIGWTNLFTRLAFSLSFNAKGRVNAQVSKDCLAINPEFFWAQENFSIGLLVHEYHHLLTKRRGDLYADEFVAHWKQYLAMKLPKDKFARINPFLLDDPNGYRLRTPAIVPFTGPADAGQVWSRYPNN